MLLLVAGCSVTISDPVEYKTESAEYLYAKGNEEMKSQNYYKAIDLFNSLNSQYPFQKYTEMANLGLIYSYYKSNQPDMALEFARQFLYLYPNSTHISYVYYIMGIINYENSKNLLQRRLPHDTSQHDPRHYLQAFDNLKRAIEINPNASYASDARKRLLYINNTLAKYEYNIAKFYFESKAYIAAINRTKNLIENYPLSNFIEDALLLLIHSYDCLGMNDLKAQSLAVLKLNFPKNLYLNSLGKE